ncbi:MAG TPA: hypothetical protein EYP55_08095 [Anaerolineae bacterium]|nr:hypothetical protein [Anaerolineae bacterium]
MINIAALFADRWTSIILGLAFLIFIFDLIDLRPQIKGFRFVFSSTYAVYYLLRITLALLAAMIIEATEAVQNPWLLAFTAVISGVSLLQNFALKFSGQEVIDLAPVFDGYQDMMIAEQAPRVIRSEKARLIKLASELAALDPEMLRSELMTMLVSTQGAEAAQRRLEELERIQDAELLKRAYASEMVQLNVEYVADRKKAWFAQARASSPQPEPSTTTEG